MEYIRLPFEQYFIDATGGSWGNNQDKVRNKVAWKKVDFDDGRHDAHYCVIYDKERDVIQVYFRDTTGAKQWISNFTFPAHYYDEFQYQGKDVQLKVARGWSKMYNHIKHYVREDFYAIWKDHKTAHVESIGFSLGSALAQLFCQDAFFNYGIKSHVFTYGSVKPWYKCIFGGKNMKWYLEQCYEECYNISNKWDLVTYMVPLTGYFKMRKIKVATKGNCIIKIFQVKNEHTAYWDSELYRDIK